MTRTFKTKNRSHHRHHHHHQEEDGFLFLVLRVEQQVLLADVLLSRMVWWSSQQLLTNPHLAYWPIWPATTLRPWLSAGGGSTDCIIVWLREMRPTTCTGCSHAVRRHRQGRAPIQGPACKKMIVTRWHHAHGYSRYVKVSTHLRHTHIHT